MKTAYLTLSTCALLSLAVLTPVRAGGPPKPDGMPASLEPGFKAFSAKCSQCHEPQRAYSKKYVEAKKIEALVSRMARKPGASISSTQRKDITAYLLWYNTRGAR